MFFEIFRYFKQRHIRKSINLIKIESLVFRILVEKRKTNYISIETVLILFIAIVLFVIRKSLAVLQFIDILIVYRQNLKIIFYIVNNDTRPENRCTRFRIRLCLR